MSNDIINEPPVVGSTEIKSNKTEKPVKCKLNGDECISLLNILKSFNAPISEEHVWALCYQCTKCFRNSFNQHPQRCKIVKRLEQVTIHKDGYVHPSTMLLPEDNNENWDANKKKKCPIESKLLAGLGYVIFQAFDFGMEEDEERAISPQLEKVLNCMIQKEETTSCEIDRLQQSQCSSSQQQFHNHHHHHQSVHQSLDQHQQGETDDEGIEKDSGEVCEDDLSSSAERIPIHNVTCDRILKLCASHVGASEIEEADQHYRAVCRALVAEALELSSFLQKVSESGTKDLRLKANTIGPSEALDCLNFSDWARLWVQIIRELRQGVNLKKVIYSRTPIEYELTPYEILMEDIRSRRYKLNKVTVDGSIPAPVKKDAHAIILEFIRSRPPLKKASDRKLRPKTRQTTPRERLLESIKQGNVKLKRPTPLAHKKVIVPSEMSTMTTSSTPSVIVNGLSQRQGSTRRVIKVDYSVIQDLYGDDDDDNEEADENDVERINSGIGGKSNGDGLPPPPHNNKSSGSDKNNNDSASTQQNVMFRTGIDNRREGIRQLWRRSYLRSGSTASSNSPVSYTTASAASIISEREKKITTDNSGNPSSPIQRSASVDLLDKISTSSSSSKRTSVNCSLL